MSESAELQNANELKIPNVAELFSQPVNEEIKPKPLFLKPWFHYFNRLGLNPDQLESTRLEFTAASVLRQAHFDWGGQKKADFKNIEELHLMGVDPARILRYLVLQTTYPKGIDLDNSTIALSLEPKDYQNLLKAVQKLPGYQTFSQDELIKLIERFGLRKNINTDGYSRRFNQDEFKEFLREIINTSSLPQLKRSAENKG